jgi:hypothetical protein
MFLELGFYSERSSLCSVSFFLQRFHDRRKGYLEPGVNWPVLRTSLITCLPPLNPQVRLFGINVVIVVGFIILSDKSI